MNRRRLARRASIKVLPTFQQSERRGDLNSSRIGIHFRGEIRWARVFFLQIDRHSTRDVLTDLTRERRSTLFSRRRDDHRLFFAALHAFPSNYLELKWNSISRVEVMETIIRAIVRFDRSTLPREHRNGDSFSLFFVFLFFFFTTDRIFYRDDFSRLVDVSVSSSNVERTTVIYAYRMSKLSHLLEHVAETWLTTGERCFSLFEEISRKRERIYSSHFLHFSQTLILFHT